MAGVLKKNQGETPKRKRDIDSSILNSFWDLADVADEKRLKGAELLLTTLAAKQGCTQAGERCKELDYVVKRLIRGLASSRKCARHGFSTVLAGVLRQYHLYSVTELLKLVHEQLKVVKSEAKSEITGTLFGRVLAYVSIIQSELIKQATDNEVSELVKALLVLRRRKVMLRPVCSLGLAQLITTIEKDPFREQVWPQIETELHEGWTDCGPDTLLLLLAAVSSKHAGKGLLTEHWDCKKIMCKGNIEHFTEVLVRSATVYQVLHPVCEELVKAALNSSDEFFADFWNKVICDGLLDPHSLNRKLLCISLATRVIALVSSADQIKTILSPKFMSCIVHQPSVKLEKMRDAIQELLLALVDFVSNCSCSESQMAVLTSLITPPGSVTFDNITRTKTVANIVAKMNAGACRLLTEFLISIIRGDNILPTGDETISVDTQRNWAVLTLSMLVTHSAVVSDTKWQQFIIQFMFLAAFFDIKTPVASIPHCDKRFTSSFSDKLRHSLQEALLRSLNKLATFNPDKEKVNQNHQLFVHHLLQLADYAQDLLDKAQSLTLLPVFDDVARQSWKDMMKTLREMSGKKDDKTPSDCHLAFQLLFLHNGFQLFMEPATTSEVLQELQICFDKVTKKKRQSKSDADLEWVDVVVDLLMSQLSTEQQLTRTVVNVAIALLTPHLTSRSLQLITDVLKPNMQTSEVIGFDDDENNEEQLEDDEGHANNEDRSDNGNDEDEDKDEDDDDDDDDDGDENEDEDEENMDVDEEVRAKVKAALGDAAGGSDAEESDLDDEAMFRLDGMLAAAFKSMRKGKQLDREKELKLKHYKMRCIDMLEQFVKHTTSASHLIALIPPLLDVAVHGWHQKESELGSRAARILTDIYHAKKLTYDSTVTTENLQDLLSKLIQQASKVTSLGPKPSNNLASAFLFVTRVSMDLENSIQAVRSSSDGKTSPSLLKTLEILKSHVDDFCIKRSSSFNHVFMQQLLEKRPDLMWPLAETFRHHVTSRDVRVFCRTQVCSWLSTVISRKLVQDMEGDKWKAFRGDIVSEILKVVLETDSENAKPLYMAQLLNLLHRVVSIDGLKENEIEESVRIQLSERLKTLRKLNKDLRTPCNRIAGLFKCRLQPEKQATVPKQKKDKKVKKPLLKNKRRKADSDAVEPTTKKSKKSTPNDTDEHPSEVVTVRESAVKKGKSVKKTNKKKMKKIVK